MNNKLKRFNWLIILWIASSFFLGYFVGDYFWSIKEIQEPKNKVILMFPKIEK